MSRAPSSAPELRNGHRHEEPRVLAGDDLAQRLPPHARLSRAHMPLACSAAVQGRTQAAPTLRRRARHLEVADRVLVRDRRRAEACHAEGQARAAGPVPALAHASHHMSCRIRRQAYWPGTCEDTCGVHAHAQTHAKSIYTVTRSRPAALSCRALVCVDEDHAPAGAVQLAAHMQPLGALGPCMSTHCRVSA